MAGYVKMRKRHTYGKCMAICGTTFGTFLLHDLFSINYSLNLILMLFIFLSKPSVY